MPLDELDEVKLKLCEQVFVTEKLTQSESAPNLSAVSDKGIRPQFLSLKINKRMH
uniref:Uncharacterized protein n=1 Tax=Vibrio parahaemolyticus TaxID=670 RepID=A0A1Y1BF01_VIBPH|nr:hypothetical protein [Vibrio parahaemolyticus]